MSYKLLIIDDDVDLVEMNRAFFTSKGFRVCKAYNGSDGLKLVKSERPDLVILDVMMTEVGEGFEVAREIRKDDDIKDTLILMMTSVNQEHNFNLTIGPDDNWNPVDDFMEKPVTHTQLYDKVIEMLKIKN